jgi:Na+-translocating ferredoxin:NAD+ oxidoreductase RnfG subunit
MHGSHKLWITISVFLVVIGLLLGMYFTATPDKVGSVIKKKQEEKMLKKAKAGQEPAKAEVKYEELSSQKMTAQEENALQGELNTGEPDGIKEENANEGEDVPGAINRQE